MKRWIGLFVVFLALGIVPLAAQTAVGTVAVKWTNASCAATVTTGTGGVETAGPCTGAVYEFTSTTGSCPASISGATWTLLTSTTAQTTSAFAYTDASTNVQFSQLRCYYGTNTFTGSLGGVASAPSVIFQVQTPAPPTSAPPAPSSPSATFTVGA